MNRLVFLSLLPFLAVGCGHKKINALEEELAGRDATIQTLQAENQGYVIQVNTLKEELGRVNRKNEELAAFYNALTSEFGPQLQSGEASLVVFPDRSLIVIGDQITFPSGSARLTPESSAALDELATFLKAHPERRFQVEGHTDAAPIHNAQFASNWELGAARALTVVDELIARGVPASRLSAATFAETAPMASNASVDGMGSNRRIAVAVELSVEETGAQEALVEAARRHNGPVYAMVTPETPNSVASSGALPADNTPVWPPQDF